MSKMRPRALSSERRRNFHPGPFGKSFVAWVFGLVQKAGHRRAAAKLRELDDRALADIGISRGEIEFLIMHGRELDLRRPRV